MDKKAVKKLIPNLITSLRIIGTVCLWFTRTFSGSFFVIYTIAGLSDAFDGFIARVTKTTSEFGAKLDSIADMLYYVTMIVKVFPVLWLELPVQMWYAAAVVAAVRIFSYVLAAVKFHCFATLHTYMNKITGFIFFVMPYAISVTGAAPFCLILLAVSALGTTEELLIHIIKAEYRSNIKSIFTA